MLLPIVAAGFIYINTTAINPEHILALEPTQDGKNCVVHLLTKNPFQVTQTCESITAKIKEQEQLNAPKKSNNILGILLAGIIGIAIGAAGIFFGREHCKKAKK